LDIRNIPAATQTCSCGVVKDWTDCTSGIFSLVE
jgi:hypothetical protein